MLVPFLCTARAHDNYDGNGLRGIEAVEVL